MPEDTDIPKTNFSERIDAILAKDEGAFGRFLLISLSAILLRLLIMPFCGHIDFFSEYRRIAYLHESGTMLFGARFITTIIETINYTIVSPLLSEKSSMFLMHDLTKSTASHLQFFGFVEHHAIYRTFLLLKLPYLLFDVAAGFVFYSLFEDKKTSIRAALIWFFNPVTIFAFYIFSRYESIPLFFVISALWALKRNRIIISSVLLGCAIWSREVNILLLPFYFVYLIRCQQTSIVSKIAATIILLTLSAFAANLLPIVLNLDDPFLAEGPESLASFDQSLGLIGFNMVWYYPIITICAMLAFWLLTVENLSHRHLYAAYGLFYCVFFIMVIHSVHYVCWSMVLFTIFAAQSKKILQALIFFCISWFVFWLVASDLGVFTHWLFTPGSLYFTNLPVFPEIVNQYLIDSRSAFNMHHVVYAFRSLYAAGFVYLAILIFNKKDKELSWES